MKIKLLVAALMMMPLLPVQAGGGHHDGGHHEEEIEKGPNNGRILSEGALSLEVAIFEKGEAPEFRVYPSFEGKPIAPQALQVAVRLVRLGEPTDNLGFNPEGHFLRSDLPVAEPHSFTVEVDAAYKGKTYQWHYDSFEGRTHIESGIADAIGIKTQAASAQKVTEKLAVYGTLKLKPNAVRHISARFPGEITALTVGLGEKVAKGQRLMQIESNESLKPYPVFAPITGVITAQDAGVGEQAREQDLLTITRIDKLIAELSVFPKDAARVAVGQTVEMAVLGASNPVTGKITRVLPELGADQTRRFWVEVDNSQGALNPGSFVRAQIHIGERRFPLAVKADSVHAFRDFKVVYAKVGEEYEVRMLDLGRRIGDWVEVLGGLTPGTEYVSENAYLIKADIEKAGASHDH